MQAQAYQAYQQATKGQQISPQMHGMMPPPPKPLTPAQQDMMDKPSWGQVMMLLKDKAHRKYHIDIETDSTIASSIESDMQGLQATLKALSDTIQGMSPLVQEGVMTIDVLKEVALTVARRARMGLAFEDAIEKMQQPKPQPNLEMLKIQAGQQQAQDKAQADIQTKQMDAQLEQQRMAMEARFEQQRADNDLRLAQAEQAYQAQQDAQAQQLEHAREMQKQEMEQRMEQVRLSMEQRQSVVENQFNMIIAKMNNAAKIEVAEIAAQSTLDAAQISAAKQAES
jgi:hypothetical protein